TQVRDAPATCAVSAEPNRVIGDPALMAVVSPLADDNTGGLWKNHCSKPDILLRQLPVKRVASSQNSRQPILSVGVTQSGVIETARQAFHRHLLRDRVLALRNGAVSNADR